MPVAPWESEQTSCVAANRGAERDKRLGLLRHGLLNQQSWLTALQLICRSSHASGKPRFAPKFIRSAKGIAVLLPFSQGVIQGLVVCRNSLKGGEENRASEESVVLKSSC